MTPDFCAVAEPDLVSVFPRHPSHLQEFASECAVLGAAVVGDASGDGGVNAVVGCQASVVFARLSIGG